MKKSKTKSSKDANNCEFVLKKKCFYYIITYSKGLYKETVIL